MNKDNFLRELKFVFSWVAIGWPWLYAFLFFLGAYTGWSRFIQYLVKDPLPPVVNWIVLKFPVPLWDYGFTLSSWGQFFAIYFAFLALTVAGWFLSRNKAISEGTMNPTGFAMFWASNLATFVLLMTVQVAGH